MRVCGVGGALVALLLAFGRCPVLTAGELADPVGKRTAGPVGERATAPIGQSTHVSLALNAIAAGALSRTNLGFGMLEGRAVLSRHLYFAAGPAVVRPEGSNTEYQARASATLLAQLGPILIDDRNLWAFSDAGTTRYRNRFRLTMPVQLNRGTLRLQLFDEAYYQQGGRGWFRNVVGVGVGSDANRTFSVDAHWMILDDDNRPQASMFLVMRTMHLL